MPSANTIRRQVGGSTVGTLAPIVNPSTNVSNFILNVGQANASGNTTPTNPTSVMLGGVIPLSAGTPSEATPIGFGTDYQGSAVANAPQFRGVLAGSGQVLHIAATGKFAGLTANSTTITLTLWEVPADIIAAGGLTQTSQTAFNGVAQTSAEEVTTANGEFTFDAYIQMDAAGNLSGTYQAQIGTNVIQLTTARDVTGLVGEADLNFVLSATLGTSAPSTAVLTIDELRIDLE